MQKEIVIRIVVEQPAAQNHRPVKRNKPATYKVVTVARAAKMLGLSTSALYFQSAGKYKKHPLIHKFEHYEKRKGRNRIGVVLRDVATAL